MFPDVVDGTRERPAKRTGERGSVLDGRGGGFRDEVMFVLGRSPGNVSVEGEGLSTYVVRG